MLVYKTSLVILVALLFNEFIADFLIISRCDWPKLTTSNEEEKELRVMILADTHLLGPIRGHWFDKLYREWHMRRAFQTALLLLRPQIVFVLGDLFDEGDFVNNEQFAKYVQRFQNHFHTPANIPLISSAGNHDIGFHYKMHPYLTDRFEKKFNGTGINLYTFHNINFVVINSMAMENDGCEFCERASKELDKISVKLKKQFDGTLSQPIIMQHFPTYRKSDENCINHDSEVLESYRENWEVLSRRATEKLGRLLKPRLFFAGHSHNYCHLRNHLGVEEYTVASFNWRNKLNPSFLLCTITQHAHSVEKCDMLKQTTVTSIYKVVIFLCILSLVFNLMQKMRKFYNKKIK